MQESNETLALQPILQPSSSAITQALYNHQVNLINDSLKQKKAPWIAILFAHGKPKGLSQDLKLLAHLSSKELLALLEESIFSLEQRHHYLQNLEQEKASRDILNENKHKLEKLKKLIYQGLLARCEMSTILHLPRQVDDLEMYLRHKINGPACVATGTLDDDSRLLIYDILNSAGFDEKMLNKVIVAVIPKRTYQKLAEAKVIQQALNDTYAFSEKICQALAINRQKPRPLQTFLIQAQIRLNSVVPDFIQLKLKKLWPWRYLLYFMLSLSAYYLLMQTLTVALVFLLSEKILAFIASALFYSVGLSRFGI